MQVVGVVPYHSNASGVPGVCYCVPVAAHPFFHFLFSYYYAIIGSCWGCYCFKSEYLPLGYGYFHCHSKCFYR